MIAREPRPEDFLQLHDSVDSLREYVMPFHCSETRSLLFCSFVIVLTIALQSQSLEEQQELVLGNVHSIHWVLCTLNFVLVHTEVLLEP